MSQDQKRERVRQLRQEIAAVMRRAGCARSQIAYRNCITRAINAQNELARLEAELKSVR